MGKSVDNKSGPEGIGGLLILVAIILVINSIRIMYETLTVFVPLWTNFDEVSKYLSSITDNWYPVIVFETVGNIFLILFALYVIWLFFSKNYKAPIMCIILPFISWVFNFVDTSLSAKMFGLAIDNQETMKVVGQFYNIVLWSAYFLMSERVKNTFVKGRKERKPVN